jgi:nucleoside-diphosphate-sugar epimerase
MAEVAGILRERLGQDARKVPRRTAPDLMVRAMALFDAEIRSVTGDLGKSLAYSNAKAKTRLGWAPRDIEDSIVDCARSLVEHPAAAPS